MSSGGRVRILVRDLSLTGVPIVLQRYLGWAASHVPDHVDVVALHGGPVATDLERLVDSLTVLEPDARRSLADATHAALGGTRLREVGRIVRATAWRHRTRHLPHPDVVLLHGAGAWPLLDAVDADVPLVIHLHELEVGMDRSIPARARAALFSRARSIMAVTPSVGQLAIGDGADATRVEVVPGVVDPTFEPSEAGGADRTGSLERPQTVAAVGAPGWRKGTDRFIALAHELSRTHPLATVTWVGGSPTGTQALFRGATDPVRWVPPSSNPWRFVSDATVLVVPSREDPLPLVALEAAQRRIPVVGGPSGGLAELLAGGRGRIAAVHDPRALHGAVAALLDDERARLEIADAAERHVVRHHTVDVVCPHWWSTIERGAAEG
jgi:glycosyltransferase involved in cell wall biosynthesis